MSPREQAGRRVEVALPRHPVVAALMENWNGAEIAASMGVSPNTVRAYLDALEQTYMIRRLLPWHANLAKDLATPWSLGRRWPATREIPCVHGAGRPCVR